MTNEYRDPLAGLRSQIGYKKSAIDALLAELTPVRRLLLNPDAVKEIDRQKAALESDGNDIGALTELLRQADALEILLSRAALRARELAQLPPAVRPLGPAPWELTLPFSRIDMKKVVGRLVAPYADATIEPWGKAAAARFTAHGHPLIAVSRGTIVSGLVRPSLIALDVALMTSVPEALPDLALHVELPGDRVINTLRLARSHRTGDELFDTTYFVSGDKEAAAVLLNESVRKALLTMSPYEARVRIGGGLAEIGWTMRARYAGAPALPAAAVGAVVALRNTLAAG